MKMGPFKGTYGVKLIHGILSSQVFCYLIYSQSLFSIYMYILVSFGRKFSNKTNSFIRFSYLAICCLSLLHHLDKINVEKAVKYIVSCKNLDGGFGCTPGGESHAGQSMLYILYCILVSNCLSLKQARVIFSVDCSESLINIFILDILRWPLED